MTSTTSTTSTTSPARARAWPAALERVFADPDDLAPRLALADELARRGDLRGDFIRLYAEYEARGTLTRAEFKALAALHRKVARDFVGPLGLDDLDCTDHCAFAEPYARYMRVDFAQKFRGGFIVSARVPGADIAVDRDGTPRELAPAPTIPLDSPWWSTVRHVAVDEPQQLHALQASLVARRVTALELGHGDGLAGLDPAAFPALAQLHAPYIRDTVDWTPLRRLPRLHRLVLGDDADHAPALAVAVDLPALQEVRFELSDGNGVTYTRDQSGDFTALTTDRRWPFVVDDLAAALAAWAARLARRVRRVTIGREGATPPERTAIAAMLRAALPDAVVTFAEPAAKPRTTARARPRPTPKPAPAQPRAKKSAVPAEPPAKKPASKRPA